MTCECGHTPRSHRKGGGPCTRCGCPQLATQPEPARRRSFPELSDAYGYAAGAAAIQGRKWFVCRRNGRWYAIEPGIANAVRANPHWPFKPQESHAS